MLAALRSRTFSLSSPAFSSPSSSSLKQWNLGLLLGLNRAFSTSLVEQNNNSVISDRKGLLKLEEVEKVLSDVKADNVQIIPMRKSDDFADFMVVATGRSPWHVRNIAQALIYKVKQKQKGAKRMLLPSVEGQEGGKWVVIDSVIPWCGSAQEIAFFQFCMEKGNPEVFYRKGMDEYFSNGNIDLGLKYLKTASDKFHIEATYAYGIILVCGGVPESTKLGLTLLNSLNGALFVKDSVEFPGKKRILECRKRTRAVVSSMWIRRRIVRRRVACYNERICRRRYRWESDHEIVDLMCCDGCRWDHEVKLFRRLLGGL